MKGLLLAAAAFALTLGAANAGSYDDAPGHFLDARHQIDMKFLPDSSEAVARLNYAKIACGATTEISAPLGCMKSHGFVWRSDTAGEIAARTKANQDARNIETLHAIGQALTGVAAAMQPHGCNGHVQPNGYFTTQCY